MSAGTAPDARDAVLRAAIVHYRELLASTRSAGQRRRPLPARTRARAERRAGRGARDARRARRALPGLARTSRRATSAAARRCSRAATCARRSRPTRRCSRTGPDSIFYEQALYKRGWSAFRMSHYEDGLASFFTLLDRKLDTRAEGSDPLAQLARAERELVDDTLRAVSISFSYLGGVDAVNEYLDATPGALRGRRVPAARRSVPHAGALQRRRADLSRLRRAPARARARALPPARRHRHLSEGGLRGRGARSEGAVRRAVRAHAAVLGDAHAGATRPRSSVQLKLHLTELAQYHHARAQAGSRSRPTTSRRYAGIARGSSPSRRKPEAAGHALPARGDPVRARALRRGRRGVRARRLRLRRACRARPSLATQRCSPTRSHEERLPADGARCLASPLDRRLAALRDGVPRPSAGAGHADARGEGAVRARARTEAAIAAARQLVAWDPTPGLEELRTGWTVLGHAHFDRARVRARPSSPTARRSRSSTRTGRSRSSCARSVRPPCTSRASSRRPRGDLAGRRRALPARERRSRRTRRSVRVPNTTPPRR